MKKYVQPSLWLTELNAEGLIAVSLMDGLGEADPTLPVYMPSQQEDNSFWGKAEWEE